MPNTGVTGEQLPVEGGVLLLGRLQLLREEPQGLPVLPDQATAAVSTPTRASLKRPPPPEGDSQILSK